MKTWTGKPTMKPTAEPIHDAPLPETPEENEQARREAMARVRQYQKRSLRGVWYLALFLIISLAAQQGFSHLPDFPPSVRKLLGAPPPPLMISGVLLLYSFSALVLILGRMTTGIGSFSGLQHLGYLSGFFIFYHFSHTLEDNFFAVLAAGLTILALEAYHVWTWHQEQIRNEKQYIVRLDRMREWKKG
jgi:hypothetical protein